MRPRQHIDIILISCCFILFIICQQQQYVSGEEETTTNRWKSRPFRNAEWVYPVEEEWRLSVIESNPRRVFNGAYLGQVDDWKNSGISGFSRFSIAQSMVADTFRLMNRSATLTPIGNELRKYLSVDNARFDFLVIGSGGLIQRAHIWRALMFSNGCDTMMPPILFLGTSFSDEAELISLDTLETLRRVTGVQPNNSAEDVVVEDEFLAEFDFSIDDDEDDQEDWKFKPSKLDIPSRYTELLKAASAMPTKYGGVSGNHTSDLLKKFSKKPLPPIGDPLLLAEQWYATSHRRGLPRFGSQVYLVNFVAPQKNGRLDYQFTKEYLVDALKELAKDAVLIFVPTEHQDVEANLKLLRTLYGELTDELADADRRLQCLGRCDIVPDLSTVLAFLKVSRGVLAFREEMALAAISVGTPVIGFGNSFGMFDVLDSAGLSSYVIDNEHLSAQRILQTVEDANKNRHLLKAHMNSVVLRSTLLHAIELARFAKHVIRHSVIDQDWRYTDGEQQLGYPPQLGAYPKVSRHPFVVIISMVQHPRIESDELVGKRLIDSIKQAQKDLMDAEYVKFVFVVNSLTPRVYATIQSVCTNMDQAEFVYSDVVNYYLDIYQWMREHRSYYEHARIYYRDILYEGQRESKLWELLEQVRDEKKLAEEQTILDPFLVSSYDGFVQFVREASVVGKYPKISRSFVQEIRQRLEQEKDGESKKDDESKKNGESKKGLNVEEIEDD